jgi:hypothetical protein
VWRLLGNKVLMCSSVIVWEGAVVRNYRRIERMGVALKVGIKTAR